MGSIGDEIFLRRLPRKPGAHISKKDVFLCQLPQSATNCGPPLSNLHSLETTKQELVLEVTKSTGTNIVRL